MENEGQTVTSENVPANLKTIKEIIHEIIDINGGVIEKLVTVNHGPTPNDSGEKGIALAGTLDQIYDLLKDARKQASKISKETNTLIGN